MGSATATKLAEWGLKPALVPAEFRAEGLLAAFPQNLVGTRILFPRAEVARELLPEELRAPALATFKNSRRGIVRFAILPRIALSRGTGKIRGISENRL